MRHVIDWFKHWFGARSCPLCHGTGRCLWRNLCGQDEYLRCYVCAGRGRV